MGTHKLFVGNIPSDISQQDLTAVFSTYGTPKDIHLMGGKSTSGQSCAFVVYDSRESAELAMTSLDNIYSIREDGSPPLSVKWAKGSGPEATGVAAVAPTSLAPQPQAADFLGAVAGLGAGLGATAAPVGLTAAGVNPLDFAAAAAAAASASAPPVIQSSAAPLMPMSTALSPLDVSIANSSIHASLGGQVGQVIGGGVVNPPPPPPLQMQQQKTKVFVGNLPADITQEAVQFVFGNYGTVTNIHVMAGKSKSGQSCAFVEYVSPLEAETAILTLHEKYEIRPGEGVILVKYANNQTGPGGMARMRPY